MRRRIFREEIDRLKAVNAQSLAALQSLFDDWLTLTEQDYNEGNADVQKIDRQTRAALKASTEA